jgi:CO/xanthine dehydrogenase Mo-binding subunit
LQQQLCAVAATVLSCPPSAVTLDNGAGIVHSAPIQRLTFAEVAATALASQRSLRAQKLYRDSQAPHMSPCTAQVVEVEVDPDTGQVRLLDVVTTHDVGTLSLGEYTLPNIKDIPPLHTVLVQEELGPAPFQGTAIGESSITPIAAALANAVHDAVGVRLHDLPITAEKVYHEIQTREGRTL